MWRRRRGPLDEAFAQTSFTPKTLLGAPHLATVVFVVVAEQMQQPMQGQDPELGELGVAGFPGLTPRHSPRDDDLP
ncbi:MAG TPA: hypothetical protein VGJ39_02955 [Vicinamibacterales bacterium]